MFQYRQVLVRMRQGDTDREIARAGLNDERRFVPSTPGRAGFRPSGAEWGVNPVRLQRRFVPTGREGASASVG